MISNDEVRLMSLQISAGHRVDVPSELLDELLLFRKAEEEKERYRHLKTNTIYTVLAKGAKLESLGPNSDSFVVYRKSIIDIPWIRPESEFNDGRFIMIDQTPSLEKPTEINTDSPHPTISVILNVYMEDGKYHISFNKPTEHCLCSYKFEYVKLSNFDIGYVSLERIKLTNEHTLDTSLKAIERLCLENARYRKALEELACLGNGEFPGTSLGNVIAQIALKRDDGD